MILFLCLGGFRRLSAMMRPAGGDPAFSRAIRRASPPALNLFFAFLRAMNSAKTRPCHLTSIECATPREVTSGAFGPRRPGCCRFHIILAPLLPRLRAICDFLNEA